MKLRLPNRMVTWPRRPLVMGILNINDDSFSNDGKVDNDWATGKAVELISQGADIIDVGAESARTNREPISPGEEIARLRNFLQHWPRIIAEATPRDTTQLSPPILSVNTWRTEVVKSILPAPVELLNDMSGLPDSRNARLCAEHGLALLLMHSVGEPKVDHSHITWKNLPGEMAEFFFQKIALSTKAGLSPEQLVIDPGLGFAKSPADDLQILRELETLHRFHRPILLPLGRKGFIGEVLDRPIPIDREAGTAACIATGMSRGGAIFRIHDVAAAFGIIKSLQPLIST